MAFAKILICDLVGLRLDASGEPDPSEVRAHVEERGGMFHTSPLEDVANLKEDRLHFFYQPHLSTREELLAAAGDGRYDAVIAAATFIPAEALFRLGGVRIGAGTGNMGSASWGGGSGEGGDAPLMNTPGVNSRATAQMVMKALLRVRPDLPLDTLHRLVVEGNFDTGRDLRRFPTEKLEGKRFAVLGFGNIGREVARLARAFAMQVTVYARESRRDSIEKEGFAFAATPQAAARGADVLSIHLGLGAFDAGAQRFANSGMVGDDVLQSLNDESVLINYDRGEVVDVAGLERALASRRVAFAAIDADIFRDPATGQLSGPLVPYLPLAEAYGERILLLPHAAADTDHPTRVTGARQAVDQIIDAIVDRRVRNRKGSLPQDYVEHSA